MYSKIVQLYIHKHTYVCVHMYIYICTYMCMCVHIHICVHASVCVCVYVCVHMASGGSNGKESACNTGDLGFLSHCGSVMSNSLRPHGLNSPWSSLSQNTGVGSHSLHQGSSQPRDWTQVYPHCKWILYHLSHKGSPRMKHYVLHKVFNAWHWH